MSETTTHLALPYLMAAQAQKHVTMNEALRLLDGIVQLSVRDRDLTAPPGSPAEGDRYIVAASATGVWTGWEGSIAYWVDGAWHRLMPQTGWLAWLVDEAILIGWTGSSWDAVGGGGNDPDFNTVGIGGASGDATNRLSVNSPATLLNHAGAGHQVKVNKDSALDTASLLFQSDWVGHAEMGLAGDNDFSIKVSANGSLWNDSLKIDSSSGFVGVGHPTPPTQLSVMGDGSGLSLFYDDSGDGYGSINVTSSSTQLVFKHVTNVASSAYIAFDPMPKDGSSIAGFRFFRGTDTTGRAQIQLFPGDNTPVVISSICGNNHSFLHNNDAYFLGIGTNSPMSKLCVEGDVTPRTSGSHTLGNSSLKWSAIWADNGVIQTSDEREKVVLGSLRDFAVEFVDQVAPVLFRWDEGGRFLSPDPAFAGQEPSNLAEIAEAAQADEPWEVPPKYLHKKPGARTHAGFLAQDVRAAMDAAGVDFGAWGLEDKDDPESRQFLRPDQLVPVLWAAVQELSREVSSLRSHLEARE